MKHRNKDKRLCWNYKHSKFAYVSLDQYAGDVYLIASNIKGNFDFISSMSLICYAINGKDS